MPLKSKQAHLFSQILMSMTQKPSLANDNQQQPGTNQAHDIKTQSRQFIKPFSKHAPFLLITFCHIQASKRPFETGCRKELSLGLYSLLDLCNDHGRSFVLAALDANAGGRPIFKALVSDWETNHRFKGEK
jgi:hypothetical protein